jgi:hypothetical protein
MTTTARSAPSSRSSRERIDALLARAGQQDREIAQLKKALIGPKWPMRCAARATRQRCGASLRSASPLG